MKISKTLLVVFGMVFVVLANVSIAQEQDDVLLEDEIVATRDGTVVKTPDTAVEDAVEADWADAADATDGRAADADFPVGGATEAGQVGDAGGATSLERGAENHDAEDAEVTGDGGGAAELAREAVEAVDAPASVPTALEDVEEVMDIAGREEAEAVAGSQAEALEEDDAAVEEFSLVANEDAEDIETGVEEDFGHIAEVARQDVATAADDRDDVLAGIDVGELLLNVEERSQEDGAVDDAAGLDAALVDIEAVGNVVDADAAGVAEGTEIINEGLPFDVVVGDDVAEAVGASEAAAAVTEAADDRAADDAGVAAVSDAVVAEAAADDVVDRAVDDAIADAAVVDDDVRAVDDGAVADAFVDGAAADAFVAIADDAVDAVVADGGVDADGFLGDGVVTDGLIADSVDAAFFDAVVTEADAPVVGDNEVIDVGMLGHAFLVDDFAEGRNEAVDEFAVEEEEQQLLFGAEEAPLLSAVGDQGAVEEVVVDGEAADEAVVGMADDIGEIEHREEATALTPVAVAIEDVAAEGREGGFIEVQGDEELGVEGVDVALEEAVDAVTTEGGEALEREDPFVDGDVVGREDHIVAVDVDTLAAEASGEVVEPTNEGPEVFNLPLDSAVVEQTVKEIDEVEVTRAAVGGEGEVDAIAERTVEEGRLIDTIVEIATADEEGGVKTESERAEMDLAAAGREEGVVEGAAEMEVVGPRADGVVGEIGVITVGEEVSKVDTAVEGIPPVEMVEEMRVEEAVITGPETAEEVFFGEFGNAKTETITVEGEAREFGEVEEVFPTIFDLEREDFDFPIAEDNDRIAFVDREEEDVKEVPGLVKEEEAIVEIDLKDTEKDVAEPIVEISAEIPDVGFEVGEVSLVNLELPVDAVEEPVLGGMGMTEVNVDPSGLFDMKADEEVTADASTDLFNPAELVELGFLSKQVGEDAEEDASESEMNASGQLSKGSMEGIIDLDFEVEEEEEPAVHYDGDGHDHESHEEMMSRQNPLNENAGAKNSTANSKMIAFLAVGVAAVLSMV